MLQLVSFVSITTLQLVHLLVLLFCSAIITFSKTTFTAICMVVGLQIAISLIHFYPLQDCDLVN
jgi:steroid 5-alpha reductase family enzyme